MNDTDPIKLSDAAAKHGWNVATLWAEHRRGNLVIFKVGRVWCTTPSSRTSGTLLKYLIFLARTRRNPVNKSGNERHYCADTVPSDRERLQSLLRIAAEQWPHKSPEDREHERRFIERDYLALTGNRLTVKR